jgi:hypothetical protein
VAWLKILGVGLFVFVVIELKKWLDAQRARAPRPAAASP